MNYQTILVNESSGITTVVFNRLKYRNSINVIFIDELSNALDEAEKDDKCKIIVLEGQNGIFCTGMDFAEVSQKSRIEESSQEDVFSVKYMELIKRFTLIPKVIISKVDGDVLAGGMGIVSASDLVIATPRSQFSLSEALWGLLPACVMPFLIRRVGFQTAYKMTLTTISVRGEEALKKHLVDELTETPDDVVRKLFLRLKRIDESTIGDMKQYFRKIWIINEEMEKTAVSEITRLVNSPKIRENIRNFVETQKFPWDKS